MHVGIRSSVMKHGGCAGVMTIESFDTNMPAITSLCCLWRKLADSPGQSATEGLGYLKLVCTQVCSNGKN
jgi:hypothetical protein